MTRVSRFLGWSALLIAAAALHATTTSAASFSITRLALSFDDSKPATIVERNGQLMAHVEISFTGSGLIQGAWEIAGPNSDGNNPQFRTLARVQQHLAGKDTAKLDSPRLPTESLGVYLVRLKISEPTMGPETPVIRYSVVEKKE